MMRSGLRASTVKESYSVGWSGTLSCIRDKVHSDRQIDTATLLRTSCRAAADHFVTADPELTEKLKMLLLNLLFVFGLAVSGAYSTCEVTNLRTYTTLDGSVLTNVAYIGEFEFGCVKTSENLYGETLGKLVQLVRSGSSYQMSWTEEVAMATKGDHVVNIYNEDGFVGFKKSLKNVQPIGSFVINHPGAYNGPWLNSEHLAAILGVLVGYIAINAKSKLLA